MRMSVSALSSKVATGHRWLVNIWNIASVTGHQSCSLYLILINWKLTLITIRSWSSCCVHCNVPLPGGPSGARQRFSPGVLGAGEDGTQLCCWQNHSWHVFWLLLSLSTKFCQASRLCRHSLVTLPTALPTRQTGTRGSVPTWIPLPLGARGSTPETLGSSTESGSLADPLVWLAGSVCSACASRPIAVQGSTTRGWAG